MNPKTPNKQFLGKYRGTVLNNIDPEQRGRLQVNVPDALGEIPSSWAEPCVPLAGPTGTPMGVYFVPAIGAGVWVEFEHGDPSLPIWSGCRWGSSADVPSAALLGNPADPNLVIQSLLQQSIVISDLPPTPLTGGIILQSTTGAMIVVNDSGIYINNGKGATVELIGPTVMINKTALTVT
jgi:Type VI secretion system/phage-baseplate injector OB domain